MKIKNKILLIGSNSDLISPLKNLSKNNNLDVLPINRKDWDLLNPKPSKKLISKIIKFNPENLVFAAGQNIKLESFSDMDKSLEYINNHFVVNCLSFISIALIMQNVLQNKLKSIHVISSLYGKYGRKSRMPYSISKHALEGAVKCLALEFPETQVIGYRPGFFKTRMTDKNINYEQQQQICKRVPSNRLGSPEEIAQIILNNILIPTKYFTGQVINIDGGLTSGGLFEI